MSKQITPLEWSEVITGLLLKPELLGELDSQEKYLNFLGDLARVVTDHCGGAVVDVHAGDPTKSDLQPIGDDLEVPAVAIMPDDRLPSINQCVFTPFDPQAWEGEEGADGEPYQEPDIAKADAVRAEIRGLQTLAYKAYADFYGTGSSRPDRRLRSASKVIKEWLNEAKRLPQRQDSTLDQLQDLRAIANHVGCYDAADVIRNLIESTSQNTEVNRLQVELDHWQQVAAWLASVHAANGYLAELKSMGKSNKSRLYNIMSTALALLKGDQLPKAYNTHGGPQRVADTIKRLEESIS